MDATTERNQRGFTLIELLITVAVIGILAAIALVNLTNIIDRSRQRSTMADMRTISVGVEVYNIDHGFLPRATSMPELKRLLIPYQSSVVPIEDRWKHPFRYSFDDAGNYTVESFGKDGVDGDDITHDTRFDTNLDMVLSNGKFIAAPE